MDGSSASGPSPVDLEPGPDFVEVRIRRRYPAGPIFEAIAGALPSGLTLYLEGATMVPAVAEYLAARPAAHAHPVKPGTILPRPKAFHMPLTPVNVTGLIELLGRHAAPEVAEHVHAYSGPAAYLIWHDAWFDSPLYLRRSVPRDALERTCEALGCELSVVPA